MQENKQFNNEWILTVIIWFFLGSFGAHRLITGKLLSGIGMGFIFFIAHFLKIILIGYLLIPVFWIIWIIDGYFIISSQFKNSKGKDIKMYLN